MPVLVDNIAQGHHLYGEAGPARTPSKEPLIVGLVNNMPDGALVSTERQVFDLLQSASEELPVRLKLYALPKVVRSDWGWEYIGQSYLGVDELQSGTLDGLIVTGAEPLAPQLTEEPYWADLEQIIDWAKRGTGSTIWSCLAVHAAVRCLDGIDRRPLAEKCIGIFEQTRTSDHPMLEGMPEKLPMPHSRWNEIPEESLVSHGYDVLTRSIESGVDAFVKQYARSLYVFLQGHPEYDALSLLGEYRRDVGRFLRREADIYPTMPKHYFNEEIQRVLLDYREHALQERQAEMLGRFPVTKAAAALHNTWRPGAHRLYHNWLNLLWSRKQH
jgi:homoserine O-succinyltransferase/O-acetyltransferase